jgi:hypothetical protein
MAMRPAATAVTAVIEVTEVTAATEAKVAAVVAAATNHRTRNACDFLIERCRHQHGGGTVFCFLATPRCLPPAP